MMTVKDLMDYIGDYSVDLDKKVIISVKDFETGRESSYETMGIMKNEEGDLILSGERDGTENVLSDEPMEPEEPTIA